MAAGADTAPSRRPHALYLFELVNGRRRLAWGESPDDALSTLRLRLGDAALADVVPGRWIRVAQRELHANVDALG